MMRTAHARFASEGQPTYFRRRWGGAPAVPYTERGVTVFSLEPAESIWIYGYSYDPDDAEDRQQLRYAWQDRRRFWAWCHSVMCPEGEPGTVPLEVVEEITEEQFEQARAREWHD
jgi:hypothetical protein